MKVLVLGVGKSGTTALLHKVAASLPDCPAYSGGRPGSHPQHHENAVYKHTVNDEKGRSGSVFLEHLESAGYDRKIWIARDPRDAAVSELLFRWYAGLKKDPRQRRECLELVRSKERDPQSVPFHRLFCMTGSAQGPDTLEAMAARVRASQDRLVKFVSELDSGWLVFRYEDMVDGRFESLDEFLGVTVASETEVPNSERRVARRKGYGDWRHWFTEQDCEVFQSLYSGYLDLIGADSADWALSPEPQIDSRYASGYIERISRKDYLDEFRRLRRRVTKRARRLVGTTPP